MIKGQLYEIGEELFMKSALTIRICSVILMIIIIIGSLIGGITIAVAYENLSIMFFIWILGIFAAIVQNALFHGFADIIDNTYATALKVNGLNLIAYQKQSGQIYFRYEGKDKKQHFDRYC